MHWYDKEKFDADHDWGLGEWGEIMNGLHVPPPSSPNINMHCLPSDHMFIFWFILEEFF